MNVIVSFRNADPSPAVVAQVERNTRSLARRLARDGRLRVVCGLDAGRADVEIVGRAGREPIVARAVHDDMYEAVDAAFDKALRQTARAHERRSRRRTMEARA